ncbi:hypothetical protein D3C76_02500 [compost metagenome]
MKNIFIDQKNFMNNIEILLNYEEQQVIDDFKKLSKEEKKEILDDIKERHESYLQTIEEFYRGIKEL